jgi:PAP2 superfamily
MSSRPSRMSLTFIAAACSLLVGACNGSEDDDAPVTITITGPNAVSHWNEIATNTVNVPASATGVGTAAEQRPNSAVDLATVQVAVYDAVIAIAGSHRAYAITPTSPTAGASQEAAAAAAAYGVLLGLFPNRTAQYQAAYDTFLATLPNDNARTLGLAVGAEVAAGILARRAGDGRMVVLPPYVPGTAPGQFRGVNPIGRPNAYIKPFVLASNNQFRAPPPPALDSATYAADVNETAALGSATGTRRTADQTEVARFHTMPPPQFWPLNMRNFAMTNRTLAEHARLMAMVWVTQADAGNACFESKYHYQTWRPSSAITLADTDGNSATTADPAWAPVVPTPNHPEYPAAHNCVSAAMAEILGHYYGTPNVTFSFSSSVTGTTRQYTTLQALVDEITEARIAGGMHLRSATVAGSALGKSVAGWVAANAFKPK